MKLKELHTSVKNTLDRVLNISESLSIIDIPKQKFFDKGDLIILLDEHQHAVSMEWFKNGHYHIELKGKIDSIFLSETLKIANHNKILEYSKLSAQLKKILKNELQILETIIEKRFSKFNNNLDKRTWLKSVQLHNGSFTEWCTTNGFEKVTNDAINEACNIADITNDHLLKKRALFSRCFLEISNYKN